VYALALPIKQVFRKALLQGRLSIHNYSRGTCDALRKTKKQIKQVQCAFVMEQLLIVAHPNMQAANTNSS
jgi:hypothetical protein